MLSCFDYYSPPLCNDVLLALCKIISLPCATLFFFLPYEIAILFVLHYFFFFPCDDFFFCLVHFDYLILHNAISLYCATLYFFSLLHYSFICFCPVQPYFFSCYSFFFILAMRNAIAFLTLHYYVFSFALHYVFCSFAQRVFFFWLLSLLCAIQFIFFPLTYFFLVLHCLIFAHFARVIVRDIFFHSLAILILLGHSLFHFVALSFYIGAR